MLEVLIIFISMFAALIIIFAPHVFETRKSKGRHRKSKKEVRDEKANEEADTYLNSLLGE